MISASARRGPASVVLDAWRSLDRTILFTVLALMTVGLMLSMAASPAADPPRGAGPFHYLVRHSLYAAAGVVVLMIASAFSIRGVRRMAGLALVGAFALLALLLVAGHEAGGAARWIRVGPLSLQPSEFLKPAFVVIAAWLISEEQRGAPVPGRALTAALWAGAAALLMLQPDFGQTLLLTALFGAVLFAAGLSWLWTAGLAASAVGLGALAYFNLAHVRSRIDAFLSIGPENSTGKEQIDFAMEAIGQGGLTGVGPGEGRVKHSLPEAHTDFIFSVAAEEFGLIASLAIIGLYAILFARAWSLALRMTDPFAQLATAGLALLFGLQALINIAVNLSLIPPKGMTLPFLSYGGSSMLALAFAAGLLLALTRRRPGAYVRAQRRAAW